MDGTEMKDLRQKAGLRQLEVALEFDIHRNTVWGWENGDRTIPKVYAEAFLSLVNDIQRTFWIKSNRKKRQHSVYIKRLN